MQIEQLHVTGFGRLVDWTPTPPLGPGVTLFYGPNEAGKSTLREFLVAMLFGFDSKVQGRHRYNPWQGADLGGEIVYSVDGDRFLLRRHLRGRTAHVELCELPGKTALPPGRADRLLATHIPVSRDLFRRLFAVDLAELTPLDAKTAHAVQEQFATDFQTLGEIASPNQALRELAAAIEEIARRGRRGPHKALVLRLEKQRRELRKQEREARNRIDDYRSQEEKHRRLEAELDALRRERIQIQNEIQRLQNLGPIRKIRGRLRALKQQRDALETWKDFPRDRSDEFDQLRRNIEIRRDTRVERSRDLEEAEKAQTDAAAALEHFPDSAQIEKLRTVTDRARSLPDIADALKELHRRKTSLEHRRTDLAHDLFPADAVEVPAAFRQTFAGDARRLRDDLDKELAAIEEIERELQQKQDRRDVVAEQIRELETEEDQLKAQVPDDYPETFNDGMLRDAEALEQLYANRDQIRQRLEALAKGRKDIEQQLEQLNAVSPPGSNPGIRTALLPGIALFAALAGIALTMLQPGGNVGLIVGILLLAGGAAGLGPMLSKLWSRRPDPATERRQRLEKELEDSAQADETVRRELEHWEKQMVHLAKRAGFDEIPESATLATAILRLRVWADAAPAVKRLEKVRRSLAEKRPEAKKLHADLDAVETRAATLRKQCAARFVASGMTPPRNYDVFRQRDRLRRAAELTEVLAEEERLTQEAVALEQDIRDRTAALDAALRRWGIETGTGDAPLSVIRRLEEFIEDALEAQRRHGDCQRAVRRAEKRADSAQQELEQARRALVEFLRRTGCETTEQFEERARAAAEFARLSEEIAEIEHDLPEVADFAAQAPEPTEGPAANTEETKAEGPADWPEERIRERLVELEIAEERTAANVRELEARQTEVRARLREQEEKVNIEGIRGILEDLDVRIRRAEQRRDVLVLTEFFLREAIEEFARTHRVPVLERAGGLLELVTGGRYRELQPQDTTSNALDRLTVVPAGGGHPVPVAALSRGTVEQVFLALRLALATEMSGGRPLPVILDDVLVNADDRRLPGCIQTIMRLGEKMQVFAFTCHERVAAEFESLGAPRRELPA
ncbi:MAG: AAA family ATPase [Kiritimatiellaeota bacterium]|nr:AAA family ATPase [Kiritimatiellota bacterium]